MASKSDMKMHLYTYFRSTSSARVRIAAHIKGIDLVYHFVSIPNGEHLSTDYEELNPNHTVPTLVVMKGKEEITRITQSVAILEYLEELFPEHAPLIPPTRQIEARAHVRQLVQIVTADIQPPTNQRILKRVRAAGEDVEKWATEIMASGLLAFEKLAAPGAGVYSFGNTLTMADVVLAPAIENAVRYGVDIETFPTVARVYRTIRDLDAFKRGDWRHQPDTPPEFRV